MPLLIDVNLGAPIGFLADGRPVFSNANRPNPNFTQNLQLHSVANSTYYRGFAALSKRFSRSVQFTASYTLGWAFNENDSTGEGENLFNTTNAAGCSGAVVSTFNAAYFRRITSTFNSRQIQLGGRLRL